MQEQRKFKCAYLEWSQHREGVKIKTTKISSGGDIGKSAKFAPAKISCYTVLMHVSYSLIHAAFYINTQARLSRHWDGFH